MRCVGEDIGTMSRTKTIPLKICYSKDSAAVSIFVVILVELTKKVVVSPPRALLNFQKATDQRGVLSGTFFL